MPDTVRPKPRGAPLRMEVVRSERLTPHMQRVVFGGPAFVRGCSSRSTDRPAGTVQVFMHGEAGLLKSLRSFLLEDRGADRSLASISGYWWAGNTEEGFRSWKSEQAKAESA